MRVVLPVDMDDERAVAAAKAVTSIPQAAESVHVTVLNVQQVVDVRGEGGRVQSGQWYDPEDFPPSVDVAVDILESAGVAVETRRAHADPAEAIIEIAEEIDADRIVMAGRKRTPVGKVLFGSVTQSVLLTAETPVTVVAT